MSSKINLAAKPEREMKRGKEARTDMAEAFDRDLSIVPALDGPSFRI
jgi:hypothetical protein